MPGTIEEQTTLKWARDLVDSKAWFLHLPTGVVTRATKLFADGLEYTSSVNQEPVNDPVLETEAGHVFVARAGNFIMLSDTDVRFYEESAEAMRQLVAAVVMTGAGLKVSRTMTFSLMQAVLHAQLMEMQRKTA